MIEWPLATRINAGEPTSAVMGYSHYVHDMKVHPEKRAELGATQ